MRVAALIFVFVLLAGCSSRVAYEPVRATVSPDAVNINTATVDELEGLPHVGRKTAEAIVTFREENGRFRRVEHLMLIRGVSEARFAELRPMVRVE